MNFRIPPQQRKAWPKVAQKLEAEFKQHVQHLAIFEEDTVTQNS